MTIRSVFVDPTQETRLVIRDAPYPTALPSQAIVRVRAVSLNRGEVRYSHTNAPEGWRPGWDVAGEVLIPAANGGPGIGARVVGLMRGGAWSEVVALELAHLAEIPTNVSFEAASTLPVAGLTALHALLKGGFLVGKHVLVTGATGGVGDFALQLARLGGARTVAHLRAPADVDADEIVIGSLKGTGPYDHVVESVGGAVLGELLGELAVDGQIVNFGNSEGVPTVFDVSDFYYPGGQRLYGLILFHELSRTEGADVGLARLGRLLAEAKLKPRIEVVEPFDKVDSVAKRLLQRDFPGKAVLTFP
jgi:NADPH:quinone reductase-like Zn-dependent oxidoreductase